MFTTNESCAYQGIMHGHAHLPLLADRLLRLDLLRGPDKVIDEDGRTRLGHHHSAR
jgi:hypothetical protein